MAVVSSYALSLGRELKGFALDLLFPPRCVGCGTHGELVCTLCVTGLPRILPPVCELCGKPQLGGVTLCPGCWGWQHSIDGIRSPFSFEGTLRDAVHSLKYRNLRGLAPLLAGLMADYLTKYPLVLDILVPVPLHGKRLNERGYNQAALLALELGRLIDAPVDQKTLVRRRDTASQARTPTAEQRQQNVAGAFFASGRDLKGKRVVLVDDVCTSGATLDSCAESLKKAGVASVWGLTLTKEL